MTAGFSRLASNLGELATGAAMGFMIFRIGTVSSYAPDGPACKVVIQPDGVETGWLPLLTGMIGSGWGVYYGPKIGDQAVCGFLQGAINAGFVAGFLPSDLTPAPTGIMSGEIHLRAKDDTANIILKADGTISSRGEWTHDGPFHATETISTGADVLADGDIVANGEVKAGGAPIALTTHVHSQPSDSHGDSQPDTGPPS